MRLRILFLLVGLASGIGAQDDDDLRELQRAFRPSRRPAEEHERRAAAIEGVAGPGFPAVARALIDAYVQLDKELEKPAERHRSALTKKQRYTGIELRPEIDGQHLLQDRIVETLTALEDAAAVEYAFERALAEDELPMHLRLGVVRLAPAVGAEALDPLGKALRSSSKPATLATALVGVAALGPEAASIGDRALAALKHRDPLVRESAAQALAALALPAAIEPLIGRLDLEEGRTRVRMVEALQVLTRVRIGASADTWRRWLARDGGPYVAGEVELGGGEILGGMSETARYHGVPIEGEAILFLLDRSRSMHKPLEAIDKDDRVLEQRIDRAKRELASALDGLSPTQRFGVIGFAASMERFSDELVEATPANVAEAKEWIERLELELGTNIYAALELAFHLAGRGTDDELFDSDIDTIFLLTDGRPRIQGPDDPERILAGARRWNVLRRVVIHSIGLGDEVPPDFLGTLARDHGGRFVLEGYEGSVDMTVRPNVVLFLVDDLGWRDAGFAGNEELRTPHMDRLAREGIRFANAYANAPNCAPSRASLLTGLSPVRHGLITVNESDRGPPTRRKLVPQTNAHGLADGFVTLAEALKTGGYATASIGKWHLGPDPALQGFDVSVGGGEQGHPHQGYFSPYDLPNLPDGPEGEYLTDRLTDEAVGFVRAHAGEPFFLLLSHYAVHQPLDVKRASRAEHAERGASNPDYAAMVGSVDESLGRVLAVLEELDLDENTIVCLFSDNGALLETTSMEPLRGQKGTIYEAGMRVPLVVRWPGRIRPDTISLRAVQGSDLFPTFLDAAGVAPPVPIDGVSLVPILVGAGDIDPRSLFWHFPAYLEPYGDSSAFRARPCSAVRQGRFKLIEFFEDGRLELYNLYQDPGETQNLVETHDEQREELYRELVTWRAETGAFVPTEPNPEFVEMGDDE